ncbi:unnamed protein product, partial [Rotaria sp. Silwood1]
KPETQTDEQNIPTPEKCYNAIIDTLNKCSYESASNQLCRTVDYKIVTKEILALDARILLQPKFQSDYNKQTRIINGRADDGHFQMIRHYELPVIRQVFNQIYGNEAKHHSIPSVVHQAVIAALNARDLFYNDDE